MTDFVTRLDDGNNIEIILNESDKTTQKQDFSTKPVLDQIWDILQAHSEVRDKVIKLIKIVNLIIKTLKKYYLIPR